MILLSTTGFSGMPDLVVWSEITLDIALWVKSKMAAIWLRSLNLYHFHHNIGIFMLLGSIMGF